MSCSAQAAPWLPVTREHTQHGQVRLLASEVVGINATVDKAPSTAGVSQRAEYRVLVGFGIACDRHHCPPRLTMRDDPITGRLVEAAEDDPATVEAQRRLTLARKAAAPMAGVPVGLAVGESTRDQAHRRRCRRQQLLITLRSTLGKIVTAKQPVCEADDE
jgi:hypothetical protein